MLLLPHTERINVMCYMMGRGSAIFACSTSRQWHIGASGDTSTILIPELGSMRAKINRFQVLLGGKQSHQY